MKEDLTTIPTEIRNRTVTTIKRLLGVYFCLSVAIISASLFLLNRMNVKTTVKGIENSVAQSVVVGDTFQIHREISSLIEGHVFDGILLESPRGVTIEYLGVITEPTFCGGEEYFCIRDGSIYITYTLNLSSSDAVVAKFFALRKAPISEFFVLLLAAMGLFAGVSFLLQRSFRDSTLSLVEPLINLSDYLKRVPSDSTRVTNRELNLRFQEVKDIFSEFESLWRRLAEAKESEKTHAKKQAELILAQQVSHDIRSPLSALEMMSSNLKELSEEKRVVIRNAINRIRDIANTLSSRKLDIAEKVAEEDNTLETILLAPAIEVIITEKRLEVRNHLNIQINFEQSKYSYGIFSKIVLNDFKRVISNLVNNSVEALENDNGRIDVAVTRGSDSSVCVVIQDNGRGMSKDVMAKLGNRGVTFRSGGTGLGIAHAKKCVEAWGGQLQIESAYGRGTTVKILLPEEEPPLWFVPKLLLTKGSKVIVLDDDQSIHQIWKGRMESVQHTKAFFESEHFSSFEHFRKFYRTAFDTLENATFLIDYEIVGSSETGLDLIEQLGIYSQSILVTSRYEENSIRVRCERLGVRLIPKSMSGFIPIEVVASQDA